MHQSRALHLALICLHLLARQQLPSQPAFHEILHRVENEMVDVGRPLASQTQILAWSCMHRSTSGAQ